MLITGANVRTNRLAELLEKIGPSSCRPCIQFNSPRVRDGFLEWPITERNGLLRLYGYEQKFKCLFHQNTVSIFLCTLPDGIIVDAGPLANNLARRLLCRLEKRLRIELS